MLDVSPAAIINVAINPECDLRTQLTSAIDEESKIEGEINALSLTMTRLREIISKAGIDPATELAALEAEHQHAVQSWISNGAQNASPKRDEAKFSAVRDRLREAEASVEDTKLGLDSLQNKFQKLATDLRIARIITTELIQKIQLEEVDSLFRSLADAENLRAALRAKILGLTIVLSAFTARNPDDIGLIRSVNNLQNRLGEFPLEPTELQCQAARQDWDKFANTLRKNPQAEFNDRQIWAERPT